ncbi:AtpZ/AtpI family protein [Thalassovita aquimarina]|uniref:AtpZ/AtpI family protein n=1 Tax=Thalassovita aquimarina TaxID=2785917 RepID=A0ABS5HNS2_9RHOB|nr:AtpZ/AtpI family protein [Thalassovita aquimarina]MBR9650610.1 AtpZ/AtpI family protein [Thalassovita aquimarina]
MSESDENLEETVGRKAERHERARQEGRHTVWFGFGMFGLVGWAVAVPTLAGVALGHWLDKVFSGAPSWTVMGLLAGVGLGCLNAWWWVNRSGGHGNGGGDAR